METFKLIKHTHGDDNCLENVVNYPIGKDQILKEGFGINCDNSKDSATMFKAVARYHNNEGKTPVFHYVTSYTKETASTPEAAMEITKKIFKTLTPTHLTGMGIHQKIREGCEYHGHTAMSPTDIKTGKMLYADNATICKLAQRMANITGQPTQLIIRKEDESEVKYPKIFVPQNDDSED